MAAPAALVPGKAKGKIEAIRVFMTVLVLGMRVPPPSPKLAWMAVAVLIGRRITVRSNSVA